MAPNILLSISTSTLYMANLLGLRFCIFAKNTGNLHHLSPVRRVHGLSCSASIPGKKFHTLEIERIVVYVLRATSSDLRAFVWVTTANALRLYTYSSATRAGLPLIVGFSVRECRILDSESRKPHGINVSCAWSKALGICHNSCGDSTTKCSEDEDPYKVSNR